LVILRQNDGVNAVDWYRWHDSYDELGSSMTAVLADTQELVAQSLDAAALGTVRILSMAAGQSRELIPVLVTHPRGMDVSAVLVEFDDRNTDFAEGALQSAELGRVTIITGDAGNTDSYATGVPADIILCCGLFEYLSDADTRRTVTALPMLCAPGAKVIYSATDHAKLSLLEKELSSAGFSIAATTLVDHSVGSATLTVDPAPWKPGAQLFELT
jgi:hypothetical protein